MSSSLAQIHQTCKSRFPRLQECAHFHYEVNTVELAKNFKCVMYKHESEQDDSAWLQLQVTSNDKKWIIYRSLDNFAYLDKHLHDCIFDRKFSLLDDLGHWLLEPAKKHSTKLLTKYLERFGQIAFINPLNCGPILNWFEMDNKGNRLLACDDSPINIPGVAAAVVRKRYVAQSPDEVNLDVGNMISVIDMPPADESVWWRGKKQLEVGFFPADCVEVIKCNQSLAEADSLGKAAPAAQSVRVKHGKLITLLRSFFNTRPARNQLQQKGILKQRVFACDLGEHLSNSGQEVPRILSICTEFIERNGTVDGIYRHTGLQSNIQRLRNAFDEERFAEIEHEVYVNDVHSVSSLLKMYFRELPNPLLTYQLYHKFIKSANVEDKIVEIHDVVQQLPPPHYRTLAYLMKHLHNLAEFAGETNMNTKNLAIVWAPNLLKSKEMDSKDCMQYDMLHSITLQANIAEFLIANADTIFNDKFASLVRRRDLNGSIKSNNGSKNYRPISVCYNNKLITLEEAQDKYKQVGPSDMPKYHTVIEIPELKKKKKKDKSVNIQHPIPTNVHIQQQFDQLSAQIPSSQSSHSIASSPIPIHKNAECHASPGSPALKSLFRTLRVGSLKHQPGSPVNQPTLQEQTDILNQKSAINTSSIVRTASTSTFKPPSVSSPCETKPDYPNCISQLQSTAQMAVQSNLSSFTGTLSSPANQSSNAIVMRNNRLNMSQNSIKSNIVRGSKPCMSTFKEFHSENNSDGVKCDIIGNNPIPSKRRTIQPTFSCSENHLKSSDSCTSIHLSTFNRQPSLKSNPVTQDENEYDDIDSITDTITDTISQDRQLTSKRESQEDEMQQIVNYINHFENSLSAPHPKSHDPNTTLIQSMIDDEEPSKLRLSSSSLSSSADSLVDEAPKIDRRTYLVNKLYDNLANNDQCFDDAHYQKVIIGKEMDSDYDNDLLVNCEDTNVMYVSATSNKAHTYHNPIEIRGSTGFEVETMIEDNSNKTSSDSETKGEAVYENLDFDNQLVELKNQIKQLLSESAECEQEIKQQITRTKSADNEVVKRAPSLCKSSSSDQMGRAAAHQGQGQLNSVKSKIKLMESIVGSKLEKSERSSSTSSSCSSSRSPPVSPMVKGTPPRTMLAETSEKRRTVKELLSKFEQSSHS